VLRRERLIDRAAEALKDYILANHLSGGDRLPSESELARSLGVSRNVVRQAVSTLETIGIVRVAQGRGIYVADVADSDVFRHIARWIDTTELDNAEFIQVRSIFERGVLELVMANASDEELDHLESIAVALRDATEEDEGGLHDRFHQALLEATGNRFLVTLGTILYRFFWSVGYTSPNVPRPPNADMHTSHLQMVQLLRRRCRDDVPLLVTLHLSPDHRPGGDGAAKPETEAAAAGSDHR